MNHIILQQDQMIEYQNYVIAFLFITNLILIVALIHLLYKQRKDTSTRLNNQLAEEYHDQF